MKKRLVTIALCIALALGALPAYALEDFESRVTIGADLSVSQREQIYKDFGLEIGEVTEIVVTNADERAYLEGLVDEKKIGSVALSCVYIVTQEEGSGLEISTNNINYCTPKMYKNALQTAGVTDAKVMVSAPYNVSGTAALTGIYKAYEDITGDTLSDLAKSAGAEELVVTGELAQMIGSEEATDLIHELKLILDETETMSDDEVRAQIKALADEYNVELTDSQVEQLLSLCRKLEKLDVAELQDKLVSLTETVQKASKFKEKVGEFATTFSEKVKTFMGKVASFFGGLFGGK